MSTEVKTLLHLLRSKGVSVEEIASQLEVSPITVYRWNTGGGISSTSLAKLRDMAREENELKHFSSTSLLNELNRRDLIGKCVDCNKVLRPKIVTYYPGGDGAYEVKLYCTSCGAVYRGELTKEK